MSSHFIQTKKCIDIKGRILFLYIIVIFLFYTRHQQNVFRSFYVPSSSHSKHIWHNLDSMNINIFRHLSLLLLVCLMCILIFEDWFGDRHHLPQQTRVLYNTQNLFDIKIKWYNLCYVDPFSLSFRNWGSYSGYLVCVSSSSIIVHHFYLDAILLDISYMQM